jgi:hypothetical protein
MEKLDFYPLLSELIISFTHANGLKNLLLDEQTALVRYFLSLPIRCGYGAAFSPKKRKTG